MAREGIITITGYAGGNAELRTTNSGGSVATFTLANTPRIKKDDAWVDGETVWFRCAIWGAAADVAVNQITKGTRLLVTGRLNIVTYEEKLQININVDEYGIKPKNVTSAVTNDIVTDDPWA
jgi:single-strand DNA-binding protein